LGNCALVLRAFELYVCVVKMIDKQRFKSNFRKNQIHRNP